KSARAGIILLPRDCKRSEHNHLEGTTVGKRPRDDDDDDRPSKKSKKAGGGNTMLFVLLGGGIAVLGLCCLCGGGGGAAGYYMGWFDGAEKKPKVAKGGDKDKSKDKDKEDVDQGPPRGTGPQVTPANFDKAARKGKTLAEIEKILGPGLLLRGAEEEKAKK